MCTVSFLPQAGGFILTSNRDERRHRHRATPPVTRNFSGTRVCAPMDPEGTGTWLAGAQTGQVLCLLNGGRKGQNHPTSGSRSRGLLAVDFWNNPDPLSFFRSISFPDYQAFTLIVAESESLFVLSWNGREAALESLDPRKAWIWSSTTLYSPPVRQQREGWFHEWKGRNPDPDWDKVWDFHLNTRREDRENGLQIRRPDGKQTVSISSVLVENEQLRMRYLDLLEEEPNPGLHKIQIPLLHSLSR